MQFKLLVAIILFSLLVTARAEQNINPELQALKQQSLLLDRDLLILQEKIRQPFSIYLSQKTDAKFVMENMTVKLDGKVLVTRKYTDRERNALRKGGAQLLYTGQLEAGKHHIIAYYKSNKNHQGGAEFSFTKKATAYGLEITLHKNKSKETRLRPLVSINRVTL